MMRFERGLLDRRAAAGRRVERGVHVAVLRVGGCRGTTRDPPGCRSPDARRAWRRARAFSLSRTSAVTSCPPRTSASRTAAPMYPVAPVRKIRIAAVYHSSLVARDTLIDFFDDLSRARGEFLVYDDGFRSRGYTYDEVARAARGVRRAAARARPAQRRQGCLLEREPPGMDRRVLGLPARAASSSCRSTTARRPIFSRASAASSPAKLVLIGQDVPPFTRADRRAGLEAARARLAGDGAAARRSRSRATTSPRSSSPPARPPSPRASSSRTATCSRTSCRSSARC